jgi:SAM-dependent methyltransferase
MNEASAERLRHVVRERYGEIARGDRASTDRAGAAAASSGCGGTREGPGAEGNETGAETAVQTCCSPPAESRTANIGAGYSAEELASVPEGSELGLGCGNPSQAAVPSRGETVLDLGSGGGVDCFLAARQVGETGRVIGVDMTPDMIERARANARRAGVENVEFRLGEIEHLPVADGSVDVILSNCVVNLSTDKEAVYREAFRVLKPGGRVAISDIVARGEIPAAIREDVELYAGCIAGAITAEENESFLKEAGFEDVRIRSRGGKADVDCGCGCEGESAPKATVRIEDWVDSVLIEARKPS